MEKILESLQIRSLKLNNRLIMPPMATSKSEGNGYVSQEILDYYNEKSIGGYVSLFIIEHSFISPEGKASENQLSVSDDASVKGLSELANIIQSNGSKAIMQINHAGSAASFDITGYTPIGPSAVPNPRLGSIPHEMTKKEIEEIVLSFADAAERVKKAGFDGVEIHSAHGYFLNQFYSPMTNKRVDEYGGSVNNRIKIHLQVIKEVRKAVGAGFPIFLRLGASDYTDGGTTLSDSLIASVEFEKAGVDVLDISGGFCGYDIGKETQGYFSELTQKIKEVVSIPVILTGGITDINAAEKLLLEGKTDLIGVGRAIYKDSKWAENSINSLKNL